MVICYSIDDGIYIGRGADPYCFPRNDETQALFACTERSDEMYSST